jgi:sugar lactone lactonase YvrE
VTRIAPTQVAAIDNSVAIVSITGRRSHKKSMVARRSTASILCALCVTLALGACGSGDSTTPSGNPSEKYALTATVSNLTGAGLVLSVNGNPVTVGSGATSAALAPGLASGTAYTVTVLTQPVGQTCSVAAGSGMIASANVANVVVTCSNQAFELGGSVSGLSASGLVLANGSDTLDVDANATSFTFATPVAQGSSYAVTVSTQPAGLACSVSHGTGTMPAGAVTSVTVRCIDQPFTVGGTITGLGNNTGLVLINGSDVLNVAANATSFTMPATVAFGSSYAVQVQGNPAGLSCSVARGSATMGAGNVASVMVTCAARSYTLGGTIAGLTQSGLVLSNGSDTLNVTSGANSFNLGDPVPYGAPYHVEVQTQPAHESCSVSGGVGTMPAGSISDVTVTCSAVTFTIGGSLSGLTRSGLVLLDNAADPTSIAANASQFSMNTGIADGGAYDVTVGTQPYGVDLACTPSNGSGTATGQVNDIAVGCSSVATPISNVLAQYFGYPAAVAVDAHGDLFVADAGNNAVMEIPYSGGTYGAPVAVGSGFNRPSGVAVDANGDVFVADTNNNAVKEIPYSGGAYGTPVTVGPTYYNVSGVAVDANGDVFVADYNNGDVQEIPYSGGAYGTARMLSAGFLQLNDLAVDANGDVFVADSGDNVVTELPCSGGVYGSPVNIGSGFSRPSGVAVDANGNVFVADSYNSAVKEVPYSGGAYGAPVVLGSGFSYPMGVAVDANGDVVVADSGNDEVEQVPYSGGTYGTPVTFGSGLSRPGGVAADADGDVFVAESDNNAVKEIPYSGGAYGAPVAVGSGFSYPNGVAVDANGDVFVADSSNNAVKEIPYSGGAYGAPVSLGSGFSNPCGVAVDANGDVFVADTYNSAVKEIPYSGGAYGAPVTLGSGFSYPGGVAVDANGDVFVADTNNSAVEEIPYSGGAYGAPVTLGSGFAYPTSVAVDDYGNVFVADTTNNSVKEIPFSGGAYGAVITLGSDYSLPDGVGVDGNGRVYVVDGESLSKLVP